MSHSIQAKYKLLLTTTISLILLIILISGFAYNRISKNTIKNKFEHLSSLQRDKINQLENWFLNNNKLLSSLATQKMTIDSFIEFKETFPLTKTDNIKTAYDLVHSKYHDSYENFLKAYNLYDIFMIDKNGDIIYSTIKEKDYGTNLLTGAFKTSGLANVFKATLNKKKGVVVFEDFKPYEPSFNKSASFIATPIYKNNELIGVFAFQISIGYLNKIMQFDKDYYQVGLGQTGENFLIGEDYKLRSDLRYLDKLNNPLVNKLNTAIGIKKIYSTTSKLAFEKNKTDGQLITKNYDDKEVLSVFHKISLDNKNWLIITQIQTKEVLKNTNILKNEIAIFSLIILGFTFLFAYTYINKIMLKLSRKEKLIQKTNKKLEDNISKLNIIMENTPIPMFYKDMEGKYTDINSKFTEVFGITKEQMIGKTVYEVANKELADIYKKQDDDLINNHKHTVQIYESKVKNPITNTDKSVVFHKSLFYDNDNKPLGIIGAVIDITESKKIHKELKKLNKNLEEKVLLEVEKNLKKEIQLFESSKLAAMGSMIGNIIHQWNQPLSLISTVSSSVLLESNMKETLESKKIEKDMQNITNAINRLTNVTRTFRNFLKEKKELKKIVLQDRLDKSLIISETVIKDKGISLVKNINYENNIEIHTIPNELTEVIINIVNNAVDAIYERNISNGKIIISLQKSQSHAEISIEDNAGGIPKNIMPNIFDEYFTTKDETKGTGLGLYMSKRIINDSLKGNLNVINTNEGAKFSIKLPLKAA